MRGFNRRHALFYLLGLSGCFFLIRQFSRLSKDHGDISDSFPTAAETTGNGHRRSESNVLAVNAKRPSAKKRNNIAFQEAPWALENTNTKDTKLLGDGPLVSTENAATPGIDVSKARNEEVISATNPRKKRGKLQRKQVGDSLLYLQHFSGSGWSNQVRSYMSAYYIAKATGRVLVTSPVLPNRRIYGDHNRLMKDNKQEFDVGYNLRKAYMRVVRPEEYIAVDKILDMEYTFPNVTTIDYKEFVASKQWTKDISTWVLEKNYSRPNTMFVLDRPDLEDTQVTDETNENGQVVTYKDIRKVAVEGKHFKMWTLLDSFQHLHPSMMPNPVRLRYKNEIRHTARIIREHVWNNLTYASLHVRAGDGPWAFRKVIWETVRKVLGNSTENIRQWLDGRRREEQSATSERLVEIGLFIATDMPQFLLPKVQESIENKMKEAFPDLSVRVLWSSSFQNYTQQLEPSLRYPGIFLDQQLAACAPIGFTPSPGAGHISVSTFSDLIMTIRNSNGAC
ncbi:expressed unknown protein [Seminavis robusta]|uniref:O-fucosyltransferase family protein n=1 Tax=Seminavis robusta TaxID=568900 RepID=A0A9N8HAK9_9STRA|nr:expressed unknown protein [Seminavis robusta]|eukprot:Sro324_g117440.1 n/a (508) ;mRNA; f:2347-3870